jgi:GNAT superfamily N-acetyltransferase
MTDHVTVRAAHVEDIPQLARLNRVVHELHVVARPDIFRHAPDAAVEGWLRDELRDGDCTAWLAEVDDEGVGYLLMFTHERAANPFSLRRRWCEIDQLAIAKTHQQQGIARRLIEVAIADAHRRGIPHIELNVWAFNTVAQAAFRALGFQPQRMRMELHSDAPSE